MFEAGMTTSDILVSATISAADLIDRDDLGTLEAGHRADIIATAESPSTISPPFTTSSS